MAKKTKYLIYHQHHPLHREIYCLHRIHQDVFSPNAVLENPMVDILLVLQRIQEPFKGENKRIRFISYSFIQQNVLVLALILYWTLVVHHCLNARVFEMAILVVEYVEYEDDQSFVVQFENHILDVFSLVLSRMRKHCSIEWE